MFKMTLQEITLIFKTQKKPASLFLGTQWTCNHFKGRYFSTVLFSSEPQATTPLGSWLGLFRTGILHQPSPQKGVFLLH